MFGFLSVCAKKLSVFQSKPDNMKIPILIGAEQGGANAGTGATSEDTTMGSATDVSQGTGGGGGSGGGGDGSSTSLQSGGSGVNSNSNSGLMALSDEDSLEPATSYGMVNSNSSQHSLSMGFKQEPLMDTDPRYA